MALKVPVDFDVASLRLDTNESYVRDELKLTIANWAKFRHTINIGNNATNLRPTSGPTIKPAIKDSYRELAKSHYEVILSLGYAKVSLGLANSASKTNRLVFQKSCKDFYFHIGCLLDNLARLIYIINDQNSAFAIFTSGSRKGKLIRHWVDWGTLLSYKGYDRLKRSKQLRAIINIRNAFTHGWSCPIYDDKNTGNLYWPIAVRTKRDFYWPHDELKDMRKQYRKRVLVLDMMQDDLQFIEAFQDKVFAKLASHVRGFEKNNGVLIM